ncbi:MAG: hypothetical protein AAGU75_19260, partial [Bacillota bacterium]
KIIVDKRYLKSLSKIDKIIYLTVGKTLKSFLMLAKGLHSLNFSIVFSIYLTGSTPRVMGMKYQQSEKNTNHST